ncbi:MAG: DUF4831 family protein [Bacteroidales bacterium]|nr:DUF4831 family protein [Bacteroidales bacterium]
MKIIHAVFLLIIILFSQCTSYKIIHVDDKFNADDKYGVYYTLPKTVLDIDVAVNKTTIVKGPLAQYASKYLGLTDVYMNNSVNYEISDINISDDFISDKEKTFFVELPQCSKNRRFHNRLFVNLTENGVISSVNFFKNFNSGKSNIEKKIIIKNDDASGKPDLQFIENLKIKYDTSIEKVLIDTVVVQRKKVTKFIIEKSNEEKAKEISEIITKLRKERISLIIGESDVSYQSETLKFMISEIDNQIQNYIQLFTGYTFTNTLKYKFTFIPDSSNLKKENLIFRFDSDNGILPKQDSSGNKVTLLIEKNENQLKNFTPVKEKNNGFSYTVPAVSKLTLKSGNEILKQCDISVSQYGIVSYLPKRKNKFKILYYQNTGAIKGLEY